MTGIAYLLAPTPVNHSSTSKRDRRGPDLGAVMDDEQTKVMEAWMRSKGADPRSGSAFVAQLREAYQAGFAAGRRAPLISP